MHHRPFPDQIQSPTWQLAFDYLQGADVNCGFELAISSVKCGGGWSLKNIRIKIP
jgi:hypothetical protein